MCVSAFPQNTFKKKHSFYDSKYLPYTIKISHSPLKLQIATESFSDSDLGENISMKIFLKKSYNLLNFSLDLSAEVPAFPEYISDRAIKFYLLTFYSFFDDSIWYGTLKNLKVDLRKYFCAKLFLSIYEVKGSGNTDGILKIEILSNNTHKNPPSLI